jgi:TP901 family phage tail tape measure protein
MTVYVLGDDRGLRGTLRNATAEVDRFVTNTQKRGSALGTVFSTSLGKGAAAGAVALGLALAGSTAAAIPFEAAMRNVNSIAHQTESAFRKTSKAVIDMSKTVPSSAVDLAKALYEINSSGFQGADGLTVLDAAAHAASAGISDATKAATAISGALNAYGLHAASAKDVSDTLFQTVNVGVVTFDELAQQLGDFVGTAAQAKVPLEDVAAAYSAITLSGIPAAEAATSVNQVLTKILNPSKDLAAVYQQLGYESGAAALQNKGLAGVISDLTKVTGGSSESMIKLFRDVRATRGVLALMAADGRNYARSLREIADPTARAGATQKAFTEQMKSTKAQLSLLGNEIMATAIVVGTHLLPPFNEFLQMAQNVGSDALPFIEAGFRAVQPVMQDVWKIIGDLVSAGHDLVTALAPAAAVIAGFGAGIALGALHGLLVAIQAITGFLADHIQIVEAAAAVYLARLVPALAAASAQMVVAAARSVYLTATTAAYVVATDGATAATAAFASAAGLMNAALTAGVAVAIFAAIRGMQQWNAAQDEATKHADDVRKSFDAYDTSKAAAQLDRLRATAQHGINVGKQYSGVWGTLKAGFSEVAGDGSVGKIAADGREAAKAYAELSQKADNVTKNIDSVSRATGLSADALRKLAQQQGIDLTTPFEQGADARQRLIDYTKDLGKESTATSVAIAQSAQVDVQAMAALEKAVEKVEDAVSKAFTSDTDVLGNFKPEKQVDLIRAAEDKLQKARDRAADVASRRGKAEAGIGKNARDTAAAQDRVSAAETRLATVRGKGTSAQVAAAERSLTAARNHLSDVTDRRAGTEAGLSKGARDSARAQDAVRRAERELANARSHGGSVAAQLEKQYKEAVRAGKNFARDINTAVSRGLDPGLVQKLLEEGPKKAGPVLAAIAADHSGHLLKIVNQSERTLSHLNDLVIQQARITALAINSEDTYFITNMRTAMAIATAEAASGGKATAQALAANLKLDPKQILAVAQRFGIIIAGGVQSALDARPVYVNVRGKRGRVEEASGARFQPQPRAEGGELFGPPGRDAAVFRGTKGEWVMPVHAVQHYGSDFMESVRTKTLPRFFEGGQVGGGWTSPVVNVAGPRVVAVPVPVKTSSSIDNSTTYNIGEVAVRDARDLQIRYRGRGYSATKGVR